MSLRSTIGKKPQVKLSGSQLTRAQKRATRSARQLRLSELSRAQKRTLRSAQKTAQRTAQSAQTAAKSAQSSAQRTAQRLSPTAGQARQMASTGVYNARVWGAPQLDRAGAYVEKELAPRVGSMLRRTAERIEPTPPRRGRRGIAATLLLAGGALGAAGAIATRRNVARKQAQGPESTSTEHLSSVSDSAGTERARTS